MPNTKKVEDIYERYARERYKNSPLLVEYEMAQQMHNYYGRMSWEIASILVAGSLATIGFSLQSAIIEKKPLLYLVITITDSLIMFAWFLLFRRIARLVDIHVRRLIQIERELHFHQHEYIHEAHKKGYINIEDEYGRKCYNLPSPRGRNSVYLLMLFLVLGIWSILIVLLFG